MVDVASCWPPSVSLGRAGIARVEAAGCDVGAVVVVRASGSGRVLVARKAPRSGFEGNDQFAFPGGLLRAPQAALDVWVRRTVANRARAEVGCSVSGLRAVRRLDAVPPVVACYTARGARRSTMILPLLGETEREFTPRSTDDSVYDPQWRTPHSLWCEITPTNGLILACLIWDDLTAAERRTAREAMAQAYTDACADAASHGLPAPLAPWEEADG